MTVRARGVGPTRGSVLDPAVVSRIGSLDLRARLVVEGFLAGLHRSPYHGYSTEFFDHRSYQPSDPPRLVDWRVFARTDRLYVKRFSDETNLRAVILVDCSASMGYRGTGPLTKMEYARTLGAAFALLLLKQRDAVGLGLFDERVRSWVRPRAAPGHLERILGELVRQEPSGTTRPLEVFTAIAGRLPRRGLVVLISDLLVPTASALRSLRSLAAGHRELLVCRILDASERDLGFEGVVSLRDVETGSVLTTLPQAVREPYRAAVRNAWQELGREAERFRAQLVDIDTSSDLVSVFSTLLAVRNRIR